jgi:phage terminase small subunit
MPKRIKQKQPRKVYTPPAVQDPVHTLGQRLTKKEQRFADEYLLDLSKHKAAERIGYTNKSAWLMGRELYDLPQVQTYITYMLTERRNKILSSQERIIQELERIAFFDVRQMLNPDNTMRQLRSYNDDEAAAVADVEFKTYGMDKRYKPRDDIDSNKRVRKDGRPTNGHGRGANPPVVEVVKTVIKKITRHNKMDALKMLGAYHGMRLSDSQHFQPVAGKQTGVIEAVNFETLLRNLNAEDLADFKRLIAKATCASDAADSDANSSEGTGGKESTSIH